MNNIIERQKIFRYNIGNDIIEKSYIIAEIVFI